MHNLRLFYKLDYLLKDSKSERCTCAELKDSVDGGEEGVVFNIRLRNVFEGLIVLIVISFTSSVETLKLYGENARFICDVMNNSLCLCDEF